MTTTLLSTSVEPLDIQQFFEVDGSEPLGFYAKGHYELSEFLAAIELAYCSSQYSFQELTGTPIDQVKVRHQWWRNVPVIENGVFQVTAFHPAQPHSRGAYPVTVWEF